MKSNSENTISARYDRNEIIPANKIVSGEVLNLFQIKIQQIHNIKDVARFMISQQENVIIVDKLPLQHGVTLTQTDKRPQDDNLADQ